MSSHVDVQISFLIAYFSTLGTEMFFARLQMMALNMEGESELSGELLATIRIVLPKTPQTHWLGAAASGS